jgi:hypothetical protein
VHHPSSAEGFSGTVPILTSWPYVTYGQTRSRRSWPTGRSTSGTSGRAAQLWMMVGRDPRSGRVLRVGILWLDEREGVLRAIHVLELDRDNNDDAVDSCRDLSSEVARGLACGRGSHEPRSQG